MKRDLAKLLRAARAAGWQVRATGSGHLQLRHPAGGVVTVSSTPAELPAVGEVLRLDTENRWQGTINSTVSRRERRLRDLGGRP
jgi:predicted RNA binding protein YcfA (HicA-like mRNA interferase family)